jgi:hypothetical protein
VGCVWMLQFQALCSTLCMWDCSACTGNGLHLQETSVKDGMFKPFRQTKVVVPNHPHAREVNWLGGAVDIKTHRWIHCNVRFKGTPEQYAPIKTAFTGIDPFPQLGWVVKDTCPTSTMYKWHYADCPVSDALMLSFETQHKEPIDFVQHVSNRYKLQASIESYPEFAKQPVVQTFKPY